MMFGLSAWIASPACWLQLKCTPAHRSRRPGDDIHFMNSTFSLNGFKVQAQVQVQECGLKNQTYLPAGRLKTQKQKQKVVQGSVPGSGFRVPGFPSTNQRINESTLLRFAAAGRQINPFSHFPSRNQPSNRLHNYTDTKIHLALPTATAYRYYSLHLLARL
jgi:hypothetical protein